MKLVDPILSAVVEKSAGDRQRDPQPLECDALSRLDSLRLFEGHDSNDDDDEESLLAAFGAGGGGDLAQAWSGGWAQLLQVRPLSCNYLVLARVTAVPPPSYQQICDCEVIFSPCILPVLLNCFAMLCCYMLL